MTLSVFPSFDEAYDRDPGDVEMRRPGGLERSDSYNKYRTSVDDSQLDNFSKDPSKFDASGAPRPPSTAI